MQIQTQLDSEMRCSEGEDKKIYRLSSSNASNYIYYIKHSYLLAWSPNRTRIWEYKFDSEFRNWIINQLEEYSLCLIDGEKVIPKPKEYKENLINQYNKIKLKWDSAGEKHEN
jgi:hypothetical protein